MKISVEKKIDNISIKVNNLDELRSLKNLIVEEGNTKVSFNYFEKDKFFVFSLKNAKKISSETIKSIEKQGFLPKL